MEVPAKCDKVAVMNLKKLAALGAFSIVLSGCMQMTVIGQMTDGSESFRGTAVGRESGTISMTSNRGRQCRGDFVYIGNRQGEGTFVCSDGKSGQFRFLTTGYRGTGTGNIGGKQFTFSFGQ